MNTRGQLDKIIATVPVLFFIFVLMGVFIFIALGMKIIKQPTTLSSVTEFSSQSSLFLPLRFEKGDLTPLSPNEATQFTGKKFVEGEYRIVPAEQEGGYLSGSGLIFGISNEQTYQSTLAQGLILMGSEERDFSYNRLIFEQALLSFLTQDKTYDSEKSVCLFSTVQDSTGFKPLFFERSERTSNKFQNIVNIKGMDTANFIYPVSLEPYWNKADYVSVTLGDSRVQLFAYYGVCL